MKNLVTALYLNLCVLTSSHSTRIGLNMEKKGETLEKESVTLK